MSAPDFATLELSIRQCNAAYIMDRQQSVDAFSFLGATFVDRLSTDSNQAVLCYAPDGALELVDCGTRASEGPIADRLGDLLQDTDCSPFDIGGGRKVAAQPFHDAKAVYDWLNTINTTDKIRLKGHSLAAWKSTYAAFYIPPERIVSIDAWESPHQGNAEFWAWLESAGVLDKITQIYHRRDPWAQWDWFDTTLNKGTAPVLWIRDGAPGWQWTLPADLPLPDLTDLYNLPDAADHGPTSVIASVAALAKQALTQVAA